MNPITPPVQPEHTDDNNNNEDDDVDSIQPEVDQEQNKDSHLQLDTSSVAEQEQKEEEALEINKDGDKDNEAVVMVDRMDEDVAVATGPATVFCIKLNQPKSNLVHQMSVPELCRNFRFKSLYLLIMIY